MGSRVPVSPGRGRQTEAKDTWWDHGGGRSCADILGKGGKGRAWRHDTGLRD
jgi:hypothetical protein